MDLEHPDLPTDLFVRMDPSFVPNFGSWTSDGSDLQCMDLFSVNHNTVGILSPLLCDLLPSIILVFLLDDNFCDQELNSSMLVSLSLL